MDAKDADVKELAEYFSTKAEIAVSEGVGDLEKVVDRARKLTDTLSSNDSLGWRCGIDVCLGHKKGPKRRCRACTSYDMAQALVAQLEEVLEERRMAAGMARDIQASWKEKGQS